MDVAVRALTNAKLTSEILNNILTIALTRTVKMKDIALIDQIRRRCGLRNTTPALSSGERGRLRDILVAQPDDPAPAG